MFLQVDQIVYCDISCTIIKCQMYMYNLEIQIIAIHIVISISDSVMSLAFSKQM